MIITRFKELLLNSIKFIYPNITISEEIYFPEESYVLLQEDGSMNVKGDIYYSKGFNIAREQQFVPNDVDLITIFIKEMDQIDSFSNINNEYFEVMRNTALSKAISSTLSSISSSTILSVIDALSKFTERTYEGNRITFGVIINDLLKCDKKSENMFSKNFVHENYTAVLTNGSESFIELDSDGYLLRYLQLNNEKSNYGLAPYDHTRILEYCGSNVVGVVLNSKGEILIFHDNELKYTKSGGRWNSYSHKEIINIIHERSENDNLLFAKSVYLTALDISFSKSGGILSFLNENEVKSALEHINIRDIVNEKYYYIKRDLLKENNEPGYEFYQDLDYYDFLEQRENNKSCVLNKILGNRKFFQLYRKLRQELVEIDGATVVDYNGDIVAIGAIIKIEAGSRGGGRIAAARTLSHYGIAIEISSDSSIKGFALDENQEPEAIFTIADYQNTGVL